MPNYMIDHTAEHLRDGARYANEKSTGDRRFQIIAMQDHVLVRGCLGGIHQSWASETIEWEIVAPAKQNPIPAVVDSLEFRLERAAERVVGRPESGQKGGHGGQEERNAAAH